MTKKMLVLLQSIFLILYKLVIDSAKARAKYSLPAASIDTLTKWFKVIQKSFFYQSWIYIPKSLCSWYWLFHRWRLGVRHNDVADFLVRRWPSGQHRPRHRQGHLHQRSKVGKAVSPNPTNLWRRRSWMLETNAGGKKESSSENFIIYFLKLFS